MRVLDVGCGAGFLSNTLAMRGHAVTGVDASPKSLETAARHDPTGRVRYCVGDARRLAGADEFPCSVFMLAVVGVVLRQRRLKNLQFLRPRGTCGRQTKRT